MSEGYFEHRELPEDGNQTPQSVTESVGFVSEFLSSYGWYLILGILGLLYLQNRYGSKLYQWQQKREKDSGLVQYDAATVLSRQEAMERARQRLQEDYNSGAAEHAERQKEKEQEKRREQIEDWERHKKGQGYRSKKLNKENSPPTGEASGSTVKKTKKPSLRPGFNPMMDGGGSGFRSSRSRLGAGGA